MSPRRRVLLSALALVSILTVAIAVPASAQFYDAARSSIGFSLDAIERSPRLLGMGRMTLVGDDPHTAITLWDFAANPVGILEADSANTAELYPATSSTSDVRNLPGDSRNLERQDQAGRETRVAYEFWRRQGGRSAYGFSGDVASLRVDHIFSDDIERRTTLSQPTIMPVLMGHLPFVKSNRWLFSTRLFYSGEKSVDQYRDLSVTSEGQYIDQDGTELTPPEFFSATDFKVRSTGGGLGLGYDRGRALKAALNVDVVQNMISGTNDAPRHSGQSDEKRPYRTGQATLVGHLGKELEWGVDGRDWSSHSEERWFFSVSAGVGADPLTGRGKLLERDESGQALRARLLWKRGPIEVGGGVSTGYRRLTITPPLLDDETSFNHFRNLVTWRVNADSLAFPDSVVYNRTEERSWEAGGGLALRLPGGRGTWGVEYHRLRDLTEQTTSGIGPLRRGWNLRTGLEYLCTPVMTGRLGYAYRSEDADSYTLQNESLGHTVTMGLGIRPTGASWTLDVGYAVEWLRADYGTPAQPRSSRQQLASMLRWAF